MATVNRFRCATYGSGFEALLAARGQSITRAARHWQNFETNWVLTDKLTIKLRYFQQKEDHELMLIDDNPTDRHFENLQGAVGLGEFGGILHGIFDPATEAVFHWKSWKNVRQRRTAVYIYVVPAARSRYLLMSGKPGDTRQAVVGFHGTFEVDGETGEVLNFTYQADHIPRELVDAGYCWRWAVQWISKGPSSSTTV